MAIQMLFRCLIHSGVSSVRWIRSHMKDWPVLLITHFAWKWQRIFLWARSTSSDGCQRTQRSPHGGTTPFMNTEHKPWSTRWTWYRTSSSKQSTTFLKHKWRQTWRERLHRFCLAHPPDRHRLHIPGGTGYFEVAQLEAHSSSPSRYSNVCYFRHLIRSVKASTNTILTLSSLKLPALQRLKWHCREPWEWPKQCQREKTVSPGPVPKCLGPPREELWAWCQ